VSDCDVCIGGDIDEVYDDFDTEVVTSSLGGTCCECRSPIQPGEAYECATGEWEGEEMEHDTCLMCMEIRDVFTCGQNYVFESLWEDMEEYAFPELTTASKCFVKLSAKAKAVVLDEWRKWKFSR
jgi:hypothetical protein